MEKNLKKSTKALMLAICAVLLVTASVMGTMAYLTSTDEVQNTFTVGQVKIKLDEAKVNNNGEPVDKDGKVVEALYSAERVQANSYKLVPGHSYVKDPTVTVLAGSQESYVRLLVTANFDNVLTNAQMATDLDDIFAVDSGNWSRYSKEVKNNVTVGEGDKAVTYGTVITYEYRWKHGAFMATTEDVKMSPLFVGLTVPSDWTNEQMADIGNLQINVVAQAIQADGFTTADAAWTAFPVTTTAE